MSMTKDYLHSLPEEEQNKILGPIDPEEEYRAAEEYAQYARQSAEDAGVDPDYEAARADWCNGCDGGCWMCADC